MPARYHIILLLYLFLLIPTALAQLTDNTTLPSNSSNSTVPDSNVTLQDSSCLNNCSGIGICNNGVCDCPQTDPATGIRWFTPPSKDCQFYGAEAYGVELVTFQASWAVLYLFGFLVMLAINISLYVQEGNSMPKNIKFFCFVLINLGFAVRAVFYVVDPYSLRQIVTPFANRILYNIFYPIVLMAYCSMLLQWIEICNPSSKYVQGKYISGTKIAGGLLVLMFVLMEVLTSFLQTSNTAGRIPLHFAVYYSFAGFIILVTVPFYIYFGNHFRRHLLSYPGAKNDKSIQRLRRKILVLSYGISLSLMLTFIVIGIAVMYTRKNSTIFLIGESFARFSEMLTLGFFVFALITPKQAQSMESEEPVAYQMTVDPSHKSVKNEGSFDIVYPDKVIVKE